MVASPSSSKPDEEYFQEQDEDGLHMVEGESATQSIDIESGMSIPMAHREYEKILRQLEAECRTHIKCEQQMKLHIECLQEKLDQVQKEFEQQKETEEAKIAMEGKKHK